jgi:Ca2+-binding RTX toxin-like protein
MGITTMFVAGTDTTETLDAADGVTESADDIRGYRGDDTLFGLGGDDHLMGGLGADTLNGGAGNDWAMYLYQVELHEGVFVSLETGRGYGGEAQGDRLISIENIRGSRYQDILVGDGGDNTLQGMRGNDTLGGGAGRDRLEGWEDNDVLKGGGGADTLDGGAGIDTASYFDSPEGVNVLLDLGHASGGDAAGDVLSGIENLTGSDHDDQLWGTDAHANVLNGGKGNDILKGGGGADTLWGGIGADTLHGGTEQDILNGEAGNDTFKFSSAAECGLSRGVADQLSDFSEAQGDKIDLSGIDANTSLAGNQAFLFIGVNNDFHADADPRGQLRFMSDGYVEGDVNGDRVADFYIAVNATTMHDYGFVL